MGCNSRQKKVDFAENEINDLHALTNHAALNKTDRTVTRSFRLSESSMKAIDEEAEKQGVSVNSFVNHLFTKYSQVDRFISKVRAIRLQDEIVKDVFEVVPDDRLIEIGKKFGTGITFKNMILAVTGGFSSENIIQFLKILADINSHGYTDVEHSGKRTITFMHNLNRKYSVLFANAITATFDGVSARPKIVTDERVVVFEF